MLREWILPVPEGRNYSFMTLHMFYFLNVLAAHYPSQPESYYSRIWSLSQKIGILISTFWWICDFQSESVLIFFRQWFCLFRQYTYWTEKKWHGLNSLKSISLWPVNLSMLSWNLFCTSTPHNFLSKPLTAFPHSHPRNTSKWKMASE